MNKATGEFANVTRIRPIDHEGHYFRCAGPLPIDPGEEPVLVQAGQSDAGRAFAARYADVVFTGQNNLAEAQTFANDMRIRAQRCGRNPNEIRIMPG